MAEEQLDENKHIRPRERACSQKLVVDNKSFNIGRQNFSRKV